MKILVCISKAPDTTAKIEFEENNTRFKEANVQFIVNPYDEWYALVRALEIKEAGSGSVTTITVGGVDHDPIIRKALAIGADDAVRVDAAGGDAFFVAKQIAEYAKTKGFDMILCGKETINFNGSQLGGMVAELLNTPYVSLASKLNVEGDKIVLEREIQGGVEVVEVKTPFVASCAKGMAEQRIPNMRGIMAARTKPLEVVPAVETKMHTSIVEYSVPPPKSDCKYVSSDNVEQLVELLHSEAKAI